LLLCPLMHIFMHGGHGHGSHGGHGEDNTQKGHNDPGYQKGYEDGLRDHKEQQKNQ
ncbi:MAG TPA: DUF2933 domain-containing protein, partial [Chromatiaceae bacterium]|nr:DUF2933 domain-containing protein [Chromatiaceae bacterium]